MLSGLLLLLGAVSTLGAEPRNAQKKLVMLVAEPEYATARSLSAFATRFLEGNFRVVALSAGVGTSALR